MPTPGFFSHSDEERAAFTMWSERGAPPDEKMTFEQHVERARRVKAEFFAPKRRNEAQEQTD